MPHHLHQTIAGALLLSVRGRIGNALLLTTARGLGLHWDTAHLVGVWRQVPLTNMPGSPLSRAAQQACAAALAQVEAAYSLVALEGDPETFRRLRGCMAALDRLFMTQLDDLEAAQHTLATSLAHLLAAQPALPFIQAQIVPTMQRTFSTLLASDDAAWRAYHAWLIERLLSQWATQDQAAQSVIAALATPEEALSRLHASADSIGAAAIPTVDFVNRNMNVHGDLVESAGAIRLDDPVAPACAPQPAKTVRFQNDHVQVRGNVYQSGGDFLRGRQPQESRSDNVILTLQCTPTPNGAQIRWRTSSHPEHTSTFVNPYPGAALPAVLRALEYQQHPAFGLSSADLTELIALGLYDQHQGLRPDLPRRVGQALYTALVNADGSIALALAAAQAAATGRPLAVRLLLPPNAIELAALPWELLCSDTPTPWLLSATPSRQFTRHLDRSTPLPPLPQQRDRPLRILALTPQVQRSPQDLALIRAKLDQLWAELQARHSIEVTEISPVRLDDLAHALRSAPDIVQFTGNGWYSQGRGVLMLDPATPGNSAHLVSADQIAVALRGARMVILTACRGAQAAAIEGGSASLLSGIAPALSAAGAPLVVGMQLGVEISAALRSTAAIYHAIADGLSVQAAIGRAREELYVSDGQQHSWYVPVLYVGTREPGAVFV
ncbi:CHAT domain-containing protein [Candidatus Oscillochloris fontis]|uniref:CHAT domain-containing protein n=1 Tax=Candidatus Oscillochloris fontis TaxID=2496868 RepID=UPI00101BAB14|nr:CHAT domain-containing protein [Candidatus Oscillochloris fontis]